MADMYDAERRIVKALPKMAKAATCPDLKAAIHSHLKETEGHVTKLEQVFKSFDHKAKGKTCEATVGLLEEGDEIAAEFKGSPAINAALISAAQKVEHLRWHPTAACTNGQGCWGTQKPPASCRKSLTRRKPPMKRSPGWRVPVATKKLSENPTKRNRRRIPRAKKRRTCAGPLS